MALQERFWSKVNINPTGCWLWTAAINEHGYGVIGRGERGTGNEKAHRLSFLWANGYLPERPLIVRHTCDVPACVNLEHLIAGTAKDNMQDCIRRKRFSFLPSQPGETNPAHKLTQ